MHQFTCHLLAEKPHFVGEMAEAAYEVWPHAEPSWALEDWQTHYQEFSGQQGIEKMLVAADSKGDFAGMASLTAYDMDTRKDLFGWLANVYIKPQHRGLGLGTWLVAQIEAQAVAEGLAELHLYTADAAEFYTSIGWEILEDTTYKGMPMTIMRKNLAAVMALHANNVVPFRR